MEIIYRTAGGDLLWRGNYSLVLQFAGPRITAGTSPLQGGIQQGIEAVFNHTVSEASSPRELPGGGPEAYLAMTAVELGLDPERSSGLLTAARMENAAFQVEVFQNLEVLAVATAGVDVNGGRAGDPASYVEEKGSFRPLPGTINIFLSMNGFLPPPTLLRALITATEAKTAALQELMAPSCYSEELATGSGTDGMIIAADPASSLLLTDAGLHAKLGELIGSSVKKAVKRALFLETGLSPRRQQSVLARLKRFQVDALLLWQRAGAGQKDRESYFRVLEKIEKEPEVVSLASAVIHLADQVRWGLLPPEAAQAAARKILSLPAEALSPVEEKGGGAAEGLIPLLLDWLNFKVLDGLPK